MRRLHRTDLQGVVKIRFEAAMDFETIHDHSESANENDNGDRGKQAWQFPRQGFSPNFWFGMRRLGGAYRLGGAEHHRMFGQKRRALPQLRTHAAGHHGRTRHSAWNDGASTIGSRGLWPPDCRLSAA